MENPKNDKTESAHEQGDFMDTPFPRVLARYCQEKRTGKIDIRNLPASQGGKLLKRVYMVEGQTFHVQGGRAQETLLEILLATQKIDKDNYDRIKAENQGDYGKIENMILTGKVVPFDQIPDLVALQTSIKLRNIFALVRGAYEFKTENAAAINKKCAPMPLPWLKVIFEGVLQHYPEARIKKEMTAVEKKAFNVGKDTAQALAPLGLDDETRKWVRDMPDTVNINFFLRGAPLDKEKSLALFLTMFFAGMIAPPAKDDNFAFGRAYLSDAEAAKAPPKKETEAKKEAPKEVKKAEEPKLPIEQMLEKDLSDKEILEQVDKLLKVAYNKEKTYFDLMGVEEKTPIPKVKIVYQKFARKFHPDARHELFQGETRQKAESLFAKFTEAYHVLTDKTDREEYLKQLKSKVSSEEMAMAQRAIEAEMEFQKAEILLKRGSWQAAREILERVIKLQPEEPEYPMYLAWVDYKTKGPSQAAKTKKQIKEILDKRPNAIDGYYYLAQIAKAEGDLDSAEKNFQKVMEARPHDIEVKREMQLLAKRFTSAPPKKKGGGLFSKKK